MSLARFERSVLSNGLTLLSEEHRAHRSLSMGIWLRSGARHEPPERGGVSHFLEHMLFKGTARRTALQIAREIDRVGGEFNAFTGRDSTCFHLFMLDRDFALGADILCDVLLNSRFEAAEIERERKVILQEILMEEDAPDELAHDLFTRLVYTRHALGQPIIGTEASVRALTRRALLSHFRSYYRPDQIVVAVAGNIAHQDFRRTIDPLIGSGWNPGPSRRSVNQEPPPFRTGRWWVERPTEQVHTVWGVPGPSHRDPNRFAAFVLNAYLGGGMSSVLFQEVREKHALAYDVYSAITSHDDSGMFSIYAATAASKVPLCLKLIEEAVQRVCDESLPESELKQIKESLKGTVLLSADDMEARMHSIARSEIHMGTHLSIEKACEAIDQVTVAQVREVAQSLFQDRERSIVFLGPKPSARLERVLGAQRMKRI